MRACLGWLQGPLQSTPMCWPQPPLTTVIRFRSFLEPQINWKCFTSVVFFIHPFLFPSTAQRNKVMGKLPR